MVGLHLLKHMDGPSDEAVCTRYLDSPYAQLFCGGVHFQHGLPLDRSSMTRWRQRIGPERLEALLAESLAAARAAARWRGSTSGASPSTPRSCPRR
jgi:IS5 family transposase